MNVQYPNDPGPDRHHNHGHFRPHKRHSLLDVETFQSAIELQTRYAYKSDAEVLRKANIYTDESVAELDQIVNKLITDANANLEEHQKAIEFLGQKVQDAESADRVQVLRFDSLQREVHDRMSSADRQHLLDRVYSMC